MKFRKELAVVILGSLLFTFFFYEKNIGLNLLLFNTFVIGALFFLKKLQLKSSLELVLLFGTAITAILLVFYNSALAIVVNFISLFLLTGVLLLPKIRNLIYASALAIINTVMAQGSFYSILQEMSKNKKGLRLALRYLKIIALPLIIVFIFLLIYKASNPFFGEYVDLFMDKIDEWLTALFRHVNVPLLMTWILGLIISNFLFLGKAEKTISNFEHAGNMQLLRQRKKHFLSFKTTGLKNEIRVAVVLFSLLNLLLFVVNLFDIFQVWFNFEWNGNYLKQFVHEGTYLLIFSIIISLALTLYYFRGNLNFYHNNKVLKILAYIWLFQNAILTISVGIRNFWYIEYFALAYKRIGVIFFLIFTLISIYLVYKKIKDKKSTYFLFSKNALTFYVLLVIMSLFNWDTIIAQYNFKHYKTAFVHLDFLSELSNKTLPYLDKTDKQLKDISKEQKQLFHFEEQFLSTTEYQKIIADRKIYFKKNWENKSWLEWNLAEQQAYDVLCKE